MNNDDKIMSLLTMAEDQLTLNAQRMEEAEQREQRQGEAFDRCLQRMVSEYHHLHQQYERNLQQRSTRFAQLLDWKIWALSIMAPVLCGALVVLAYTLYLQSVRDELYSIERILESLKNYNAVLSHCHYDEKTHLCVRVRTDWPAYGENRNYLVVDPK